MLKSNSSRSEDCMVLNFTSRRGHGAIICFLWLNRLLALSQPESSIALGKGIRDAPRDAFVADITVSDRRGTGFGLRLALAFSGFVAGPLIAIALMRLSGDNFRL